MRSINLMEKKEVPLSNITSIELYGILQINLNFSHLQMVHGSRDWLDQVILVAELRLGEAFLELEDLI